MEKSCRINLRCTPEEKAAWEKAANGKVSTWLRDLANAEAKPPEEPAPAAWREATKKPMANKCPRWMHHRPGVYCGCCGK